MRKFFVLAGIILALIFPAMSFGADTEIILTVNGTDYIIDPPVTQDYTEDTETGEITKGVVTFPAFSATNYTFDTIENALEFAKNPQVYIQNNYDGYINEDSYDIEYDSSLQTTMTAVTVSIELGAISYAVDLTSYSAITDITFTATPTSLTGPYGERHFIAGSTSNVTFRNIIFIGNSEGGGVEASDGTVTFSGCTFNGCYTSGDGGGVLVTGGTAIFTNNTTFTNCSASTNGGGLAVTGGTVSMDSTTFTGCNADTNGGAIFTRRSLTISGSSFSENSAESGGAISVTGGSTTIDNTTFADNSATSGGAVYSSAGLNIGEDVKFNTGSFPNVATNGGAIYIGGGTTNITGSSVEFTENTASENGGAIYVASGRLNISGSDILFSSNTVSNDGGAICTSGDLTISSSSLSFDSNTASEGSGGAIMAGGGAKINITGAVSFTNNEANLGGAVYLAATRRGLTALNITGENEATFSNNTAGTDGGAIYAEQYSTMTFTPAVNFTSNTATNGNGGALWIYDAAQLPEGTIYFTKNTTSLQSKSKTSPTGCGGAIYIGGSSTSSMTFGSTRNYTFSGNSALSYGGAICTYSSDIVFDGYIVSDENKATLGGGFAASLHSKITLRNSSEISNQTTEGYGGALYSLGGLDITDSILRENSTTGTAQDQGGGAIYAENSQVNITNSYFVSNTTEHGNGGAIVLYNYCTSIITGTTFRGNQSSYLNGGAIFAQGNMSITLCYLQDNQSRNSGGAIYFDQNNDTPSSYSKFTMSSTMLTGNSTSGFKGNGGGLYVVANNATITSCTFSENRLELAGNEGYGGGAYVAAIPIQDEDIEIINCTFYDNHIGEGISGSSGGGGLAIYCEKTTIVKSCTFAANGSQYKGGGIYLGDGSLQLSGTMLVGNTDEGIYDIWSDGSITSGGYNRIGVYGTGSGVTDFYSETRNDSDRTAYPSKGWTRSTFFSNNTLAVNPRTDLGSNVPPYLGSTLTNQVRLLTLMLSEDASLPLVDRATNIIPYTRRGMFPTTDERGVARISQGAQIALDIGACFFDGTRITSDDRETASYTISRLEISGIPNNLRRVGQTASLIAKVYYTNGRTALGGYGDGEEPVEWTSDKPNIVRINKDTGDLTVLSFTPGNTYVTITATTVRGNTSGQRISDKQAIRVTEYSYSYLNTSPEIMTTLQRYAQELVEYDITLQLADISSAAVSSSSFQSIFAGIWGNVRASQVTDLTSAALICEKVNSYTASDGYILAAGKPGMNVNFSGLKEGDILPIIYSWTFSGSELQSILGYDMSGKTVTPSVADEIFSAMRIDFQGANSSWHVIGSGGVKASEAISAGALTLTSADSGKGITAEFTAYLANVTASASNVSSSANDGPQLVGGMLIVPDGVGNDSRIYGSMFMAAKSSSGVSNNISTNTGTNTGTGVKGSSGGGCESSGAVLSLLALILMAGRKLKRQERN